MYHLQHITHNKINEGEQRMNVKQQIDQNASKYGSHAGLIMHTENQQKRMSNSKRW